jgi:hypothetical protein
MALDLPSIVAAEKTLSVVPKWLLRRHQDWLEVSAPLDISGVTVEGLYLRAQARQNLPEEAVTFQLEYRPPPKVRLRGGPLWRIEWRPLSGHSNKGRGPPELRFKLQTGSHHHPFDLNWAEEPKAVRRGNLPIAVPFPADFEDTYDGLVAFVGQQFKIGNIGVVTTPPWSGVFL